MQLSCLIGYRQHQWFDFLFQCNISFSISLCYTVLQVFLDGKSPDSQRFVAEKFYPNWVSHPEWASISIFPITPSSRSYKPAKCASDDAECNVRVNRYISIEKTDLHELHLQRALNLSIPRREQCWEHTKTDIRFRDFADKTNHTRFFQASQLTNVVQCEQSFFGIFKCAWLL